VHNLLVGEEYQRRLQDDAKIRIMGSAAMVSFSLANVMDDKKQKVL